MPHQPTNVSVGDFLNSPQRLTASALQNKKEQMHPDFESEELYDVERIVDKRKEINRETGKLEVQYLVQYKGYGSEENEWRTTDELIFIQDMIDSFEQELKV